MAKGIPLDTLMEKPAPLSADELEKREEIVRIWRRAFSPPANSDLVGSDAEWAFWAALLDRFRP